MFVPSEYMPDGTHRSSNLHIRQAAIHAALALPESTDGAAVVANARIILSFFNESQPAGSQSVGQPNVPEAEKLPLDTAEPSQVPTGPLVASDPPKRRGRPRKAVVAGEAPAETAVAPVQDIPVTGALTSDPKPETASSEPAASNPNDNFTLDDVRNALVNAQTRFGSITPVKELLAGFSPTGVLSGLPVEKYGEVIAAANKL